MKKAPATSDSQHAEVDVSISLAGVLVRLLALLYDFLLVVACILVVSVVLITAGTLVFSAQGETSQAATTLPNWFRYGVLFPAMSASVVGFYALFWQKSGQTLGMQTWRLQTVDEEGKLLGFKQSLMRCFGACVLPLTCAFLAKVLFASLASFAVAFCFGFLANYLFIWFHPSKRAAHDLLSKTLTVKIPARQAGLISDIKKLNKRKAS